MNMAGLFMTLSGFNILDYTTTTTTNTVERLNSKENLH